MKPEIPQPDIIKQIESIKRQVTERHADTPERKLVLLDLHLLSKHYWKMVAEEFAELEKEYNDSNE